MIRAGYGSIRAAEAAIRKKSRPKNLMRVTGKPLDQEH
jgi:hypothetical protein